MQKKHIISLNEFGFKPVQTKDGSWTLQGVEPDSELMHHSAGAVAETIYVYGHCLSQFIATQSVETKSVLRLNILSVGLGVGINEMVTAAVLVKNKLAVKSTLMHSLETQPILVTQWLNFVREEEVQQNLLNIYQENLRKVSEQMDVESEKIKFFLKEAYSENWSIKDGLFAGFSCNSPFNIIFYDAFSSHTNPELWDEDFLTGFLNQVAANKCAVSTYASKSTLQRALKNTGFQLFKRPGFSSKRECLFAVKNSSDL